MKSNQKHLTLSDRIIIEQSLNEGISFKFIAKQIYSKTTTYSCTYERWIYIAKYSNDCYRELIDV